MLANAAIGALAASYREVVNYWTSQAWQPPLPTIDEWLKGASAMTPAMSDERRGLITETAYREAGRAQMYFMRGCGWIDITIGPTVTGLGRVNRALFTDDWDFLMATAAGPVAGSLRRFQIANGGKPPVALDDSDDQGQLMYEHLLDTVSQLQAGDRADMTRAMDAVPWWKADPADPDWETHLFEEAALQLLGVWPRVDRLSQALLTAYPRPLTFAECVPILSG